MNYIASPRGKGRYKRSFRKRSNQRAAKERKRLTAEKLPGESLYVAHTRAMFASVTIRFGNERVSFRVGRWDKARLLCFGKVQSASTVGRRVALALDALL